MMNKIELALERTTDTKGVIIGEGSAAQTAGLFLKLFPGCKAIAVADRNTWEVAGRTVQKSLDEAGVETYEPFVFDSPDLYAEWTFVEQLEEEMRKNDAIAVAVGSGVINDLVKYVSSVLGRRYMCVGTAASMDGYTAYGASISKDGNKQTFDCPAPYGFVMDPVIAARAPKELAASGYADLIAKIPAGADWMIADACGAEKIDLFSWNLVQNGLKEALADPAAVFEGDVKITEKLSEGLLMSGFAMQALQSSRPASGTEHQFSHCWDMEDLCHNGKHVSHGFKVGIGTLVSTACLEFLLSKDIENLDVESCVSSWKSWEDQEREVREVFAGMPGHLARGLKETRDKYVSREELRIQLESLKQSWPVLKKKIREQIIPFTEVYKALRLVGAPYEPEHIGISNSRLRSTFICIPYMRSRFTAMDVLYRCGYMSEAIEYLFGSEGHWPVQDS